MVDRKRLFPLRPWREISNLQDLLDTSESLVDAVIEDSKALVLHMRDLVNYIEQAQIIVESSDRKGAKILHGMGKRLMRQE